MRKAITTIVIFCFTITPAFSASLEKAALLNQHGLTDDAKRELIDVIFEAGSTSKEQAKAYYLLGNIAYTENKFEVAIKSWGYLVKTYPESDEAILVKDRINELSKTASIHTRKSVDNAIAEAYLKNADFWSKDRSDTFFIDTSWIPKLNASLKWYDKVIAEFPGSNAARIAYEEKLKTILASNGLNPKHQFYILPVFDANMALSVATFEGFEIEYPKASTLQAFRYRIAQAYWGRSIQFGYENAEYFELGKKWFKDVVVAGTNNSFYHDLAKRRLENLKPR